VSVTVGRSSTPKSPSPPLPQFTTRNFQPPHIQKKMSNTTGNKMITPVLTPEKWEYYLSMFEEAGMEVYESITAVHVAEQPLIPDGGRVESLLEMREIEEQLHQQLYAVHEIMEERQLPEDEQREILRAWVGEVRITVSSLLNVEPEEIVERHRPWEL
jgi:hypothetical protein